MLGFFRLGLQGSHPAFQLTHDIPQPHQVLFRLGQTLFCFSLAVAELGDSRRFLKNLPALGAFGADDLSDLSLFNNGVTVPPQPCIHKNLVDVLETDRILVDPIFTFSAAVKLPGDDDFITVHLDTAVGVVDGQRNPGQALGLSGLGAAKNNIFHFGAPQGFAGLFAKHPFDSVADVAFTAAIGTDDGGNPVIEGQFGSIRKGFESLHFDASQLQTDTSCSLI